MSQEYFKIHLKKNRKIWKISGSLRLINCLILGLMVIGLILLVDINLEADCFDEFERNACSYDTK